LNSVTSKRVAGGRSGIRGKTVRPFKRMRKKGALKKGEGTGEEEEKAGAS